jgi:NADPH:quinone reductase-like Zn-dependent oxidoreductase
MKAAICTGYGSPDLVQIRDVPKPAPRQGEVLIKVYAATVNRTDCGVLRAHPFPIRFIYGWNGPKQPILGMDFAGEVEALGAGATKFAIGDRVFGMQSMLRLGAHAEYMCAPESPYLALMPAGLQFDEAVVCEGAYYAYCSLKALHLESGRNILIYGASGAIGSAAVQLAKALGAKVTAVVASRHVDLAKSLGADCVVDYTKGDFSKIGEKFDCILDAVGKTTFFRCRRLLKVGGQFAATDAGPGGQTLLLMLWTSLTGSKRVFCVMPRRYPEFNDYLKGLMDAKRFRAVIDRRYPFDQIADAYRYVETGQKTGIVVVQAPDFSPSSQPPSRHGAAPKNQS